MRNAELDPPGVHEVKELASQVNSQIAAQVVAEEGEILEASLKAGTIAQIVVAFIAVIGLIYLLKLVLATILTAVLLAYLLEPFVKGLAVWRIPRWDAVLATVMAFGGLAYFSYNSAISFLGEFSHYSAGAQESLEHVRQQASEIENQARSTAPASSKAGEGSLAARVQQTQGAAAGLIAKSSGAILDGLMVIGFMPFLVYFMLTFRDRTHVATVRLFPTEHRVVAHRTLSRISAMIRTYIVANVLIGILNSVICGAVFGFLGIKYFYFLGVLSGFAGLIPYLGVFLALLPPLAGGLGTLDKTGMIAVVVAVVVLHVLTMNVLYPKFIGNRLKLNPLGVSLSLLFWAWIWGPLGLILAMPILGATKIVCDHISPLQGVGSWLGEWPA